MTAYVFLGPSLPLPEARAIVDAVYLPPVAMGDLYALVQARARRGDVVAIVDGFFEQVPAVWHKEILHALARGVRVLGASSMGALRAAELHPFGMIGVGRIFEAFRDGAIEDDDEVVVVHGPPEHGYRPLSEAMVNVRAALGEAEARGLIDGATHAALLAIAKGQFYAERTWGSVLAAAGALPAAQLAALRDFIRRERPDAKRRDAEELLRRVAAELASPAPAPEPSFVLEETSFWIGLTRARAAGPEAAPAAAIIDHARALAPDRAELWRGALLLHLAAEQGAALPITRDEVQATARRFCRQRGLRSAGELDAWRAAQGLGKDELLWLLEIETRLDVLTRRARPQVDALVALELKRRGRYRELADGAERKWRNLERLGLAKPTLDDAGVDAAALQRWYEARCGRLGRDAFEHVEELGFGSLREFVSELLATYLLENQAA
jgi:hypothetical protein